MLGDGALGSDEEAPAAAVVERDRGAGDGEDLALREDLGVILLRLGQVEERLGGDICGLAPEHEAEYEGAAEQRRVVGLDHAQAKLEAAIVLHGAREDAEGDDVDRADRRGVAGAGAGEAGEHAVVLLLQRLAEAAGEQPGAVGEEHEALGRERVAVREEAADLLVDVAQRRAEAQQLHARGLLERDVELLPGRLGGAGEAGAQEVLDRPRELLEQGGELLLLGRGQVAEAAGGRRELGWFGGRRLAVVLADLRPRVGGGLEAEHALEHVQAGVGREQGHGGVAGVAGDRVEHRPQAGGDVGEALALVAIGEGLEGREVGGAHGGEATHDEVDHPRAEVLEGAGDLFDLCHRSP